MTIIISHRGNLTGPSKEENTEKSIAIAISEGFDVEIDVWVLDKKIFLGHDKPERPIDLEFLVELKDKLWIHCKNLESLCYFSEKSDFEFFWHQNDDFTLTKKNFIWTYPEKPLGNMSVAVMPINEEKVLKDFNPYGICTDYPRRVKEIVNSRKTKNE